MKNTISSWGCIIISNVNVVTGNNLWSVIWFVGALFYMVLEIKEMKLERKSRQELLDKLVDMDEELKKTIKEYEEKVEAEKAQQGKPKE